MPMLIYLPLVSCLYKADFLFTNQIIYNEKKCTLRFTRSRFIDVMYQ